MCFCSAAPGKSHTGDTFPSAKWRSSIRTFPLWTKVLYFARVMAKLPLLSKWQKCQKCIVRSLISSLNTGSLSLTLSKCFPARIYLKGCACLVFKMLASRRETLYSRIYFASKKDLEMHSPRFVECILHLESGNREGRCLEGDRERTRNEKASEAGIGSELRTALSRRIEQQAQHVSWGRYFMQKQS